MTKHSLTLALLISYLLFGLPPSVSQASDNHSLTLVSQNLNRLFDDKNDGNKEKVVSTEKYQKRLHKLVSKIRSEFEFADVLAFQEIENIDILTDAQKILSDEYQQRYLPILIEGNDQSGIDVAFLIKQNWRIENTRSLFQQTTFNSPPQKLFSRPPLVIEICNSQCFSVMNLHLRSMRGLRSVNKGKRVALKRRAQAETIAKWINQFQQDHPNKQLIVSGDFNALTPSDRYVDSVGTILGKPDQKRPRWTSPDLVSKDLIDTSKRVKAKYRYSYLYKKKKQQLDYLLISRNLKNRIQQLQFSAIDYSFSDHAALKASFKLD